MTMTVEDRINYAYDIHSQGFNCSQCVALATCDLVGLDKDLAFRLAEGLGGGLGGFTETCGAVNGAAMILSYANSSGMELHSTKLATYELVNSMVTDFRNECGGTLCQKLRPKENIMQVCNGYIAEAIRQVCARLDKDAAE